MYGCSAYMYACVMKLELQMSVSHCVDAENQTQALWKGVSALKLWAISQGPWCQELWRKNTESNAIIASHSKFQSLLPKSFPLCGQGRGRSASMSHVPAMYMPLVPVYMDFLKSIAVNDRWEESKGRLHRLNNLKNSKEATNSSPFLLAYEWIAQKYAMLILSYDPGWSILNYWTNYSILYFVSITL